MPHHHCPPGTPTLPMGPGAPFQLCLGHPVLAPVTIREQQAWSCTGRRERVPHSTGRAVSSPSGVQSYSLSFLFERWQYIALPTISFTPPSPAQSAMSKFDPGDNYFSVRKSAPPCHLLLPLHKYQEILVVASSHAEMQIYCLLSFFGNTLCKSFCLCPDPC